MLLKYEKILFITVFFLIISLPFIFVNKKEGAISIAENRKLASPPTLYKVDGTINSDYSSDFEEWFNDNLGFRDNIVTFDAIIKYYIFDELNNMPLGPNGELAAYQSLNEFQHADILETDEVNTIAESYQTVYEYLDSQNIQVYYMQCWDKNTIYPEQYPETISVLNEVSKCDQIENALSQQTGISVIPIKQKLFSEKEKYRLYGTWAEPWHWVQRGAFVAYTELINGINAKNDGIYDVLTEDDFDITTEDVGETFFGKIHEPDYEEVFKLKNPHAASVNEKLEYFPDGGIREHAGYYENNSVGNDTKVLILGDSYFHDYGILTYLAESFHTVIMFNGTAAYGEGNLFNLINAYKPNIVIFENAERCSYRFDEMKDIAKQVRNREYDLGNKILFGSEESMYERYEIAGFSFAEDGYTWTDEKEASLVLYNEDFSKGKRHFKMELSGVYNSEQFVTIRINGTEFFSGELTDEKIIEFDFNNPKGKVISINIEIPNAISPFELGEGLDSRTLGIMLKSITIS